MALSILKARLIPEAVDALICGPDGQPRFAILLVELRIKLGNSCREMLNLKRLGSLSQHSVDPAKVISNTVQEVHPSDHFFGNSTSEDGIPMPASVVVVYFGACISRRRFFSLGAMDWIRRSGPYVSGCSVLS